MPCPDGLRVAACEDVLFPRKGYFDSTSESFTEDAHAYIIDNENIPEGASPINLEETWDSVHMTYDPALINTAERTNRLWDEDGDRLDSRFFRERNS